MASRNTAIGAAVLLTSSVIATALPSPPSPSSVGTSLGRSVGGPVISSALEARSLISDIFGGGSDTNGYAPYNVTCPTNITWVRTADSIGTVESEYLDARASQLTSAWQTQMKNVNLTMPSRTPVVAMALSGGGYRAMISGSGQAFKKNDTAGSVGDILGLSTYVGGLSGGSWAVSSFFANDGASPDDLNANVWNLASNLILPSDNKVSFYTDLIEEVHDKSDEGYPTQITDYWALALSDHLFPSQYRTDTSPNLTITDIRSFPAVANASLPYPVILSVEREPGELVVAVNSTIWEFTLGEFGSWFWGSDYKRQGGFTNVQYLGTSMDDGTPTNDDDGCVLGFSNMGFIAGTSSTLFNEGFLELNDSDSSSLITSAIQSILSEIGQDDNDVSVFPNPFINWATDNNPIAGFKNLTLVDGGEAGENVPLDPFLQTHREVDCILAFDNSADTTYAWPNGTSLYTSYQKGLAQAEKYNMTNRMPQVPSMNGFVNGGYNQRPTFFGCNDTTGATPIVVYVPNSPWSEYSNTTTFTLEYSQELASAIIDNGRRTIDLNGTVSNWPQCLTCAMIDRAVTNTSTRSAECQSCFDTWCWKGDDNTTTPNEYEPLLGVYPDLIQQLTGSNGTGTVINSSEASGAKMMVGVQGVMAVGLAALVMGMSMIM